MSAHIEDSPDSLRYVLHRSTKEHFIIQDTGALDSSRLY